MKALIVSLGGTPEPIIKSIETHRPDFVCFFASQQAAEHIKTVKDALERPPEHHLALVRDVNRLEDCYEDALKCGRVLQEKGIQPGDTVVDYTGGTKTMSAALVLATVSLGYRFSYVGGKERTKEGLGVVVGGTEVVHTGPSPWDVLAVADLRRLEWAFNRHAYCVSLGIAQEIQERAGLSGKTRALLRGLEPLARAYLFWDRFEHGRIGDSLRQGRDNLQLYRESTGTRGLEGLLAGVEANLEFLEAFRRSSKEFESLSPYHVSDLVGNAERRAEEGKFDDAIARLYRSLEMTAQVALLRRRNPIRTGEVPVEAVPEPLREEFELRYRDEKSGFLKLPLLASYRLLRALDHPVGHRFFEREEEFNKILGARNHSILAHGVTVHDKRTFQRFRSLVEELLDKPSPRFPRLHLETVA